MQKTVMQKRIIIPINDMNNNIYIFIGNDGTLKIETDSSIKFIKKYITLEKKHNELLISVFGKNIATITKEGIKTINHLSSTELRCIYDYINNSFSEAKDNLVSLYRHNYNENINPFTELHTHLIEILDSSDLLLFMQKYFPNIKIPFNNNQLDFINGIPCPIFELNIQQLNSVKESTSLPLEGQSDFEVLSAKNRFRRKLLNLCEIEYADQENLDLVNDSDYIKDHIVYLLLKESLLKLQQQGILYAEISYSNIRTLQYLIEQDYEDLEIQFKLLKSIDRNSPGKAYRQAMREDHLYLYENNLIKGIDIMGFEEPLTEFDFEKTTLSNKSDNSFCKPKNSLYYQLLQLVPKLSKIPKSVLRLHAGEFQNCTDNVYMSLLILDTLVKDCGLSLPPPQIRIGHAININERPELIKLLYKYDCIIEFNLTSNYCLGNIKSLEELPIKYYLKQNPPIKYVLSTDGGGMYQTTGLQEANIFESLIDNKSYYKNEREYMGRL